MAGLNEKGVRKWNGRGISWSVFARETLPIVNGKLIQLTLGKKIAAGARFLAQEQVGILIQNEIHKEPAEHKLGALPESTIP